MRARAATLQRDNFDGAFLVISRAPGKNLFTRKFPDGAYVKTEKVVLLDHEENLA
jgi:hypothetical protein